MNGNWLIDSLGIRCSYLLYSDNGFRYGTTSYSLRYINQVRPTPSRVRPVTPYTLNRTGCRVNPSKRPQSALGLVDLFVIYGIGKYIFAIIFTLM